MNLYNSEVKVLKLHEIPETGDLMFSLANPSYLSIIKNGEVQIDYTGVDNDAAHTPADRAAIGVDKEGTTILVEVEGHGVTIAQLANIMKLLDSNYAAVTDIAVIKTYELLELEKENKGKVQYDSDRSAPIARPTTVVEVSSEGKPETKTKKRK